MRLFFSIAIVMLSMALQAQNTERCYTESDTLLIVGGQLIDNDHFMIDRNLLLNNDTIIVNRSGLKVESFVFSAFALGQKVTLTNDGNVLSDEFVEHLLNKESIFKFFYLKDIILRTSDGRKVSPSTRNIKITFTN